jgi:hypothetical protein
MVAVGIAVLVGITRIKNPYSNFHNIFEGSTSNVHSLAMGLVKTNFAFVGWHNAFNVLGEVRSTDPVRTIRKAGIISLTLVTVLFVLINVAYIAAVPREEIRDSGQLIAALFFHHVFGDSWGAKVLPALVALSTFGNIVSGSHRLHCIALMEPLLDSCGKFSPGLCLCKRVVLKPFCRPLDRPVSSAKLLDKDYSLILRFLHLLNHLVHHSHLWSSSTPRLFLSSSPFPEKTRSIFLLTWLAIPI